MINLTAYGFEVVARAPSVEKNEASYETVSEEMQAVVPAEVRRLWPALDFRINPVTHRLITTGKIVETHVQCKALVVEPGVNLNLVLNCYQRGPKLWVDLYIESKGPPVIRNSVNRGSQVRTVIAKRSMSLSADNRAKTTSTRVGHDIKRFIAEVSTEIKTLIAEAIKKSADDLKAAEEKGTNPSHISKCKTFYTLYKAMETFV